MKARFVAFSKRRRSIIPERFYENSLVTGNQRGGCEFLKNNGGWIKHMGGGDVSLRRWTLNALSRCSGRNKRRKGNGRKKGHVGDGETRRPNARRDDYIRVLRHGFATSLTRSPQTHRRSNIDLLFSIKAESYVLLYSPLAKFRTITSVRLVEISFTLFLFFFLPLL